MINAAQAEPRVGSPAHGALPETIARRVGDSWRITGRKNYVTGIPILKWVALLALTDEETPRLPYDGDRYTAEKGSFISHVVERARSAADDASPLTS